MVKPNRDSTLAFALLGLIWQEPRSGYDLRKFFSSTPMISFSDSPGAIYPALHRLEQRGLVRGHTAQGAGLRRRRIFELTVRGRADAAVRLHGSVCRERRRPPIPESLPQRACRIHSESSEIPQIEPAAYAPSGRLALESGIQAYETQLRW